MSQEDPLAERVREGERAEGVAIGIPELEGFDSIFDVFGRAPGWTPRFMSRVRSRPTIFNSETHGHLGRGRDSILNHMRDAWHKLSFQEPITQVSL